MSYAEPCCCYAEYPDLIISLIQSQLIPCPTSGPTAYPTGEMTHLQSVIIVTWILFSVPGGIVSVAKACNSNTRGKNSHSEEIFRSRQPSSRQRLQSPCKSKQGEDSMGTSLPSSWMRVVYHSKPLWSKYGDIKSKNLSPLPLLVLLQQLMLYYNHYNNYSYHYTITTTYVPKPLLSLPSSIR